MADFISRSLTTRRAKKSEKVSAVPSRAFSMRKPSVNRVQISGPVNLISTTNMLSYHAPDIAAMRQPSAESASSSGSGRTSTEESDRSSTSSSRAASTDASSVESLPTSPGANHLTGFFDSAQKTEKEKAILQRSASTSAHNKPSRRPSLDQIKKSLDRKISIDGINKTHEPANSRVKRSLDSKRSMDSISRPQVHQAKMSLDSARSIDGLNKTQASVPKTSEVSPAIPQRARSHSKEAHELMARKRSIRNMGPPSSLHSRSSSAQEQRASVDMFKAEVDRDHPFGRELEQLNEVVEELGGVIRDVALDEDTKLMQERGLQKFCAADYLAEITPFIPLAYLKHGSRTNSDAEHGVDLDGVDPRRRTRRLRRWMCSKCRSPRNATALFQAHGDPHDGGLARQDG